MLHELVATILRSHFGWPADEAPEPTAVDEFAEANPDLSAEEIAARIDGYLDDATHGQAPPYGWTGTAKEYLRQTYFTHGVKYWRENTNIALGVIVIPHVPQGRIAKTVDEWWDNQEKGLSYLGYPLLGDTPLGNEEKAARWAAASAIPYAWLFTGLGLVYQLLTREDMLKKWVKPGFTPPAEHLGGKVENFYGCNAQKVLDNLLAGQKGRPPRWLDDQGWIKNPDPGAWK